MDKRRKTGELGVVGLDMVAGIIRDAYSEELNWPNVWKDVYKKLYRADSEVSIVQLIYNVWSRNAEIMVRMPKDANEDDKRAAKFFEEVLDDVEGGIFKWQEKAMSTTPFMGWSVFEIIPCVRKENWRPPNGGDWRSEYDDGLIGIRKFGWRDYSSFSHWDADDETMALKGFVQRTNMGREINIPYNRLLHLTFGDPYNPHGKSPLEALYRLERIKYGFELVFGIGMEKAAGHLSVNVEKTPSPDDLTKLRTAARSILSVQQGNFAVWPEGVSAEVIDATFTAASALLDAIRHYHLLKLQVMFASQWIAISSTAETGTYSAARDTSQMALTIYNSTFSSIITSFDKVVGRMLWRWNKHHFPNATSRPRFIAKEVKKEISPMEISQLLAMIAPVMPLGEQDFIEIRRHTGMLPIELPENPLHNPLATGLEKKPKDKDGGPDLKLRKDAKKVSEAAAVNDESKSFSGESEEDKSD